MSADGVLHPSVQAAERSTQRLQVEVARRATLQNFNFPWQDVALSEGASSTVKLTPNVGQAQSSELRSLALNAPTRAIHTVRQGDSFLTLALRYYDDASKSDFILEANRRNLTEDGELIVGQLLRIPEIEQL
ncbi:MAG: LysM peptidoglycan-binding domain-containing protein [Pseudomonadota bacterium]